MNLTEYIPANTSWINAYIEQMGFEDLKQYYDKVFLMLLNMPAGSEFYVIEHVDPKRYDLFIKCVTTAVTEIYRSDPAHTKNYFLENNATVLIVR